LESGREVTTWEVFGEGVVGAFPIVKPGQQYNYSSQGTGLLGDKLSGHFTFVPGTRANPTGPEFDVMCPTLTWTDDGFFF
jgi:uncharacterized protein affecting Mg2+/Co2+ transport